MEHDTVDATIRRLVREEIEASRQGRDSLLLDEKFPAHSQNRSGAPSRQDAERPGAAGVRQDSALQRDSNHSSGGHCDQISNR